MFSTSSKTVSCAKYGTSVYSFPSPSIIDSIDITFESNYSLKSVISDYDERLKVSSKF